MKYPGFEMKLFEAASQYSTDEIFDPKMLFQNELSMDKFYMILQRIKNRFWLYWIPTIHITMC